MAINKVSQALAPRAPFVWGADGKPLSKEEAEARRAAADRLRAPAGYTPKGWMSLLGSLAGEGVGQVKENEAVAAEKAGHSKVADALAKARETGDYMGVMSDEWATPQQMSVAGALQNRGWQQQDQQATWARQDAMRAADAAKADWKTIEVGGDIMRYNANDPNSRPEMFFDGPDAAPERQVVNGQLVDPTTGKVVGDYRDPAAPPDAKVVNDQLVDPVTGKVIGDYRNPDAAKQPLINAGGGSIYDPNTDQWKSNPAAPAGGAADFDDISGIRKEVHQLPSYKNLSQATPIYAAMSETAGRDSRASDLNLVYGLGKIMDPTSVVREGEMFMVQGINTLPDKLVEGINSVLTGTSTLSQDTRKAILTEAFGRVKGYEDAYNQDATAYKDLAGRYKINPDDILPNFKPNAPWEPQADPAAGGGDVPSIADDAGYDALPSGATFRAPDGSIRQKP